MMKMLAIRMCANWFKQFENDDFDISDKVRSKHPATVEEDELQKNWKKSWKTIENTLINLIYYIDFFIVIKKLQKIGKNFCTDLIIELYIFQVLIFNAQYLCLFYSSFF